MKAILALNNTKSYPKSGNQVALNAMFFGHKPDPDRAPVDAAGFVSRRSAFVYFCLG